jgi:hypothetical protein
MAAIRQKKEATKAKSAQLELQLQQALSLFESLDDQEEKQKQPLLPLLDDKPFFIDFE